MRNLAIAVGLAALSAAYTSASDFDAASDMTTRTEQEIISRCRDAVGGYGSAIVQDCVDQDIEALSALKEYPPEYRHFVDICYARMGEYGYLMVKACADQDIWAEKALTSH